jgi:hypothetical protein
METITQTPTLAEQLIASNLTMKPASYGGAAHLRVYFSHSISEEEVLQAELQRYREALPSVIAEMVRRLKHARPSATFQEGACKEFVNQITNILNPEGSFMDFTWPLGDENVAGTGVAITLRIMSHNVTGGKGLTDWVIDVNAFKTVDGKKLFSRKHVVNVQMRKQFAN